MADRLRTIGQVFDYTFPQSSTKRSEILDEIMFFILERAKCEEDTDKYLEHVLDYCKKDYQKAYDKKKKD